MSVRLTPRKHFLAHWLLTKTMAGRQKYQMLNALQCMRRSRAGSMPKTSWRYAVARKAAQEAQKTRVVSDEMRANMRAAQKGKIISEAQAKRHSEIMKAKGITLSPERLAALVARNTGNKYRLGQKDGAETREKKRLNSLGNKSRSGQKTGDATKRKMIITRLDPSAPPQRNNKVGLRGVDRLPGGTYRARAKVGGKQICVGIFTCPAAASFAHVIAVDIYRQQIA